MTLNTEAFAKALAAGIAAYEEDVVGNSGWIEWAGGNDSPVSGLVEFRCRDGYSDTADAQQLATSMGCNWWNHTEARDAWNCSGDCRDDDIVAYRIAE